MRCALSQVVQSIPDPHPAKARLAERRITVIEVARRAGRNPHYVGRVLNGWLPTTPHIRTTLVELLDLPEEQLFRDEDATS